MAPHSSTLAWKIPWRRSLVGCSPWGRWGSDTTERLDFHFSLWCIGEGNGNPLQCSCLENPRDGGAWWAAVHGVAQSRTQLKWLSSSNHVFWNAVLTVNGFPCHPCLCGTAGSVTQENPSPLASPDPRMWGVKGSSGQRTREVPKAGCGDTGQEWGPGQACCCVVCSFIHPFFSCSCLVAKNCLTLWDPMDHSPPGSSVHGISRQEY